MQQLTVREQQIKEYYFDKKESPEKIAKKLGIKLSSFKVYLRSLKRKLELDKAEKTKTKKTNPVAKALTQVKKLATKKPAKKAPKKPEAPKEAAPTGAIKANITNKSGGAIKATTAIANFRKAICDACGFKSKCSICAFKKTYNQHFIDASFK